LMPQDPNDEPAAELLKKITAEKSRLLKEGQIKKQKLLPPIEEDEKPFDLPKGWEWIRLNEIGHNWGQKTPDSNFTYIDVGAINKELGFVSEPSILNANTAPSRARKIVKKGTVIYSTVRPYLLNIAVINEQFEPEPIASTAFAIIHPFDGILASFIYRYLRSPTFISYVESCQTGIAYPAINDKQFFSGLYPVAPLAEQHLIVAKVDELMALCNQLEQRTETSISAHQTLVQTLLGALTNASKLDGFNQAWARIAKHFDTLFTTEWSIDQLKQTILQLAVMGKLVPQNPNDEPASELLKKIAAEKVKLIKEGKIKKQKLLQPIREGEKPFELPMGWEWKRIAEYSIVGTGSTPARDNISYYTPPEFNWVTSGETSSDFVFKTKEHVSQKAINETNVSIYPVGTLIVAMYGQGKTRGQITELMIEAGTNQACAAIQLIDKSKHHRGYTKLFFKKAYEELRSHAAGGAQPNLNVGKISLTVVPIPPLEEQYRIVIKVDELMSLCDILKKHINTTQITQLQLADAMTEQALG